MNVDARLNRLAKQAADGCGCGKPATVAVVQDPGYDGNAVAEAPDLPERCPICGRPEPVTIQVVEDPGWYQNRAHDLGGPCP